MLLDTKVFEFDPSIHQIETFRGILREDIKKWANDKNSLGQIRVVSLEKFDKAFVVWFYRYIGETL